MNVLFVGPGWRGSAARSLRDSLERRSDVRVAEVAEDEYLPRYDSLPLRISNRLLRRWQRVEFETAIRRKLDALQTDILLVYKGNGVSPSLVGETGSRGVVTVNVFPDYSPHAYGSRLAEAVGKYHLVLSTKPFHPSNWESVYGYSNRCVFVPHGYDSSVHYCPAPPRRGSFDVALAASWRPEYERLMAGLAEELRATSTSVVVSGPRWIERWRGRPSCWDYREGSFGRAYTEFVRQARIVIAPVHRRVVINGRHQPGDEDTMRTYELAAAYTFFLHQRTDYVETVYDEHSEVPMWSSPSELADLIRYYLPREVERRDMARAAHARAVPAYSIDKRAEEIVNHLRAELDARSS